MENNFLLFIALILAFLLVIYITQYCWNETISKISNTKSITYYEAFLLIVLFGILVKNPCLCLGECINKT